MINIDYVDDGLPISVIVPLSEKRKKFFYGYTLPLIEANEPKEIIINSYGGSAPKKRNDGFEKSTQPYVFFCDDDILLPSNLLSKLYKLITNNDVSFVYTGYDGIVMNPNKHPMKGNYKIKSEKFNIKNLKKYNYISTMTLIKRDCFIGFDEKLKRFQDWDLFLSLVKKGHKGLFCNDLTFIAFYLDDSITTDNTNLKNSINYLQKKHENFLKW